MSTKPLRLTIHPRLEDTNLNAYEIHQGHRTTLRLAQAKRLTEAELCAEYEAARCDAMMQSHTGRCWQPLDYTWPMDPEAIHNRARTLLRFALAPHYFEATEPESDTE